MWNVWTTIISKASDYFAPGGAALLLTACLLFLLVRKKDKTGQSLFWPSVVMLLVIFCPVSAWIIMKLIGADVYWRIFWVLPAGVIIAYTAVQLISLAKGHGKQILTGLACAGAIALCGSFVFTDTYFEARENNYKLPTEVIWVADAISEHAQEQNIKRKKILAPMGIATYIRIYDASLRQPYGRPTARGEREGKPYFHEINADEHDFDFLASEANRLKRRYLVIKKVSDDQSAMEERNFQKICETPTYVVYFNLRYQKKTG